MYAFFNTGNPKVCAEPVIHTYGNPVVKLGNFPITGSKVRYSCKNHYTMVGSPERFCRNDAKWSGDDPYCLGKLPLFIKTAIIIVDNSKNS